MKKFLSDVLINCDLTVSGSTSLGAATGVTVATSDNSNKIATTAWVKSLGFSTANTTYLLDVPANTTNFRLIGSDSSTDTITLSAAGASSITRVSASELRITSTDSVDYISNVTFANDVITFTGVGEGFNGTINLSTYLTQTEGDARYLQSYSETDTLDTVTSRDGVTTNTIGVGTINVIGTTAGQELLTVDGTYGRLFTVTDDLSDSLFSVNTIAGLPALEVFADNTIKLGAFANPITIDSNSNISIPGTITASGYNDSNWNTAYNDRITAAAVSGTTTKTLTLTQGDGGTITASWTDINTDTDGYISSVSLTGSSLDFTGVGSAFTGSIDLSSLTGGENFVDIVGDNMTGLLTLPALQFQGATGTIGTMQWNTEDETVDLVVSPDVTYQLGQELGVVARNLSGATLLNGTVVQVTGASGNKITVEIADSNSELDSAATFAVVTETIANNSTGHITTNGLVRDLDTSLLAEGVALWLGPGGTFTDIKPLTPQHLVHIGWVVRSHPTEGSILVRISNGWELEELHDVLITSITDNEILQWNNGGGYWENRTLAEANIATADHNHAGVYDNYQSWNLKTNGVQRTTVQSGGNLDIVAGTNVAVSYGAGGVVTISSTDTNTDTNNYLTGLSFNTTSGVLTATRQGLGNLTVDLDGRYLTSFTESDPIFLASPAGGIVAEMINQWNSAFAWGDHSLAGYLTSYTETDPIFSAHVSSGITAIKISNWDTAYSWGNHASAGYLTSETLTQLSIVNNILSYRDETGAVTELDLSLYLDDTNLARLTSGTLNGTTGIATFTRDDATTFTVDFSAFLADANNYVDALSFNTTNGVLTVGRNGSLADLTVDLDGRFLTSYTETDPIFSASPAAGITPEQITNWDVAHSWGDHGTVGYLTSVPAEYVTATEITNYSISPRFGSTIGMGNDSAVIEFQDSNAYTKATYWTNLDAVLINGDGNSNNNIILRTGNILVNQNQFISGKLGVNTRIEFSDDVASAMYQAGGTGDPVGTVIETFSSAVNIGAFIDFTIYNTGKDSMRSGTLQLVFNADQVMFNEVNTMDIGDTTPCTLTAVNNAGVVEVHYTTPDPTFHIKYHVRTL